MSFHLRSNSSFVSWKIVFYYKCDKYQNCKFLNFNISGSFWLISNQKSFLKSVNNERSFETKFMVFQIWKTLICQKSIFRSKIRKKNQNFIFFQNFRSISNLKPVCNQWIASFYLRLSSFSRSIKPCTLNIEKLNYEIFSFRVFLSS